MSEPARYRATLFGRPLAPWRTRRVLAYQDAIDERHGSREWSTGYIFLDEAVFIEHDAAEEPITPELHRLAQALAFHARNGDRAIEAAEIRLGAARDEADALAWREVIEHLGTIRRQAQQRADEQERRAAEE